MCSLVHSSPSTEEVSKILAESDLIQRASLLLRLAKRVVGKEESLFVTPTDIVSVRVELPRHSVCELTVCVQANPHLNLAFTATLFNKIAGERRVSACGGAPADTHPPRSGSSLGGLGAGHARAETSRQRL